MTEPSLTSPAADSERAGNDKSPSPWRTRLSWVVVIVIAYVLSPLPVNIFLILLPPRVAVSAERYLEVAYSPLAWLYGHSQKVQEFYDWYGSLI